MDYDQTEMAAAFDRGRDTRPDDIAVWFALLRAPQ
jgi:hypothetical protein